MNYDSELVDKALRDGHAIANKLKKATSIKEVDCLREEIDEYGDFVCEAFGVIDDDDPFEEPNCDLSLLLHLAAEAKCRHMCYDPRRFKANNYEIKEFEKYLDGKSWLRVTLLSRGF